MINQVTHRNTPRASDAIYYDIHSIILQATAIIYLFRSAMLVFNEIVYKNKAHTRGRLMHAPNSPVENAPTSPELGVHKKQQTVITRSHDFLSPPNFIQLCLIISLIT